jgi:hypothetical protein
MMSSLLGTYDFRAGTVPIKAVSIVTPGADLPATRHVSGIECVIHDTATLARRDYVAGASDIIPRWSVYLICWDGSDGLVMTSAAIRLMEIFAGASVNETVAVPQGLGAMAQMLVSIPSDSPILA